MDEVQPLDGIVLATLLIAMLRGAYIGMIRESFSIGALAAACVVLRLGNPDASAWLEQISRGLIPGGLTAWISGAVLFVGTIAVVGIVGRHLKRGAQAVGLGWADRVGGGALGIAEGAIVATILVSAAVLALGRDHPSVEHTHSVEAVSVLRTYVMENIDALPSVASEPPRS
jgi:membrane protein required for colicin V production